MRRPRTKYFLVMMVWWCVPNVVLGTSHDDQQDALLDDLRMEGSVEVRNDPGEDGGASLCPASCFCEEEAGYATCVGDDQWAPPTLPTGLTRVELRGFLVPELGSAQLHHLPGLRELQLNQCNVTRLYDDAFATMADLDRLDLSENRLMVLGPDSFRGLRSLRHLDLSANRLANLTQPFTHLPALQHLNLRDNALTSLTQDTFQGLDRVQYVNLDANKILNVEVAAFQHLTSLAHLILSNNPLSSLATLDFFGSRLQYIDVSNIGISRVPQALTQFVRDLRLAKNSIREIQRGDLDSYPYLGLLVLDDNGLEVLEEDALGRHEYLARLWLNGNKLKNIPLSLPPALHALYVEENLITGLHEGDFRVQSKLEQLFLQRNHIAIIAPSALSELTSLHTLDLKANRLTNLTGRVFSRLASLVKLDLSQNPILTLDADVMTGLTSVRVLQMSRIHSSSVEIPDTLFDPLKGLQILEMYGSPQIVVQLVNTTRMLHSLRGIRELNIMHNDLSVLRPDFPSFFPKLQVAKLSGNTWDCGSPGKVMWMKRWMTHSPVHFYRSYNIRCSTPVSFGYKPVMLLEDNDFSTSTVSVPFTSIKKPGTLPFLSIQVSTTTVVLEAEGADRQTPLVSKAANVGNSSLVEVNDQGIWVNDAGSKNKTDTALLPELVANNNVMRGNRNFSLFGVDSNLTDDNSFPITASKDTTGEMFTTTVPATSESMENFVGTDRDDKDTTTYKTIKFSSSRSIVTPTKVTAAVTEGLDATTTTTLSSDVSQETWPYWIVHNRMPPENFTSKTKKYANYIPKGNIQHTYRKATIIKAENKKRIKKMFKKNPNIRVLSPDTKTRSSNTQQKEGSSQYPVALDHSKDLWIFRGDNNHGLIPGQPLPIGMSHGRVSDGAVVSAGIVASCVGLALLIGGFLLARGRGKGGPMWEASTYWRDGADEDVVMAVGVGSTGTGLMTQSEGTVGVVTETHRGLNNRLYLLLQRDSTTGITPDTLPDPRSHSPAPDWH